MNNRPADLGVGARASGDDAVSQLERLYAEFALLSDLTLTLGRTLDAAAVRSEVLNVAQALTGAAVARIAIKSGDDARPVAPFFLVASARR